MGDLNGKRGRIQGSAAVGGGGPSGIACAIRLLELGHEVTVIEQGARRYPTAGYHEAFLASLGTLLVACAGTFSVRETFGKHEAD